MFDSIKGAFSGPEPADCWHVLEKPEEVSDVAEASRTSPQLIYKHSYRCATCLFARQRIEDIADDIRKKATLHFVDVLARRPVSDRITEMLAVRHESPQLLLLYRGKVVWHASHGAIKADAVLSELKKLDVPVDT
ncbi:bacillithiol system redox-active protein YtxJ [Fodinibius sediminis]|uniref:bacillithiol system redox-active protein YtxJ n=1 Tax=Fodinibius sediminis TaxID=1214077 RepID=UPI00163D45C2|nr:bacillithiol system redox-active protein YtxJ [Fodinibius sediminis]